MYHNDGVTGLARADGVEELGEVDEEPSNWRDHQNADHDEGDVLRPKCDVDLEAQFIDNDFGRQRDWVLLAHAIENDVHRAHDDFVGTVERKKVSEKVEPATFQRFRILFE